MFSPPPVQLTIAQIEQAEEARLERENQEASRPAKEKEKWKGGERNRSARTYRPRIEDVKSISPRVETPGLASKSITFGKPVKSDVKPFEMPSAGAGNYENVENSSAVTQHTEIKRVSKQSRKASLPPQRPARPPAAQSLIDQPRLYSLPAETKQFRKGAMTVSSETSSRKVSHTSDQSSLSSSSNTSWAGPTNTKLSVEKTLNARDNFGEDILQVAVARRMTAASPASERSASSSFQALDWIFNLPRRATDGAALDRKRQAGVQIGKIDRGGVLKRSEARDGRSGTPRTRSASELRLPRKRLLHGQKMSMLVDGRFLPSQHNGKGRARTLAPLPLAQRASLLRTTNRDFLDSSDSVVSTPVELYRTLPKYSRPRLSVSTTTVRSNNSSPRESDELSQSRLRVIPEILDNISEGTLPEPQATKPLTTEEHSRGRSTVTVVPLQSNIGQRSIYFPGPIKLPEQPVMTQKNPVATFEASENAVEHVDHGSPDSSQRRRSDDSAVDDICEWFDKFGFKEVGLTTDVRVTEAMDSDDMQEAQRAIPMQKAVAKKFVKTNESFRTGDSTGVNPLSSPRIASPGEKSLIICDGTRTCIKSPSAIEYLPVQRIKHSSEARKDSIVSAASSDALPVSPNMEKTKIESGLCNINTTQDENVVDVGDDEQSEHEIEDVEEMMAAESWLPLELSTTLSNSSRSQSPTMSAWQARMCSRHSGDMLWHTESGRRPSKTVRGRVNGYAL